jgi:hypothetical protein
VRSLFLLVLPIAIAAADPALTQPAAPLTPSDPAAWWSAEQIVPEQRFDPLGRRRPGRHEVPAPVDNGIDPSLYRLWGLPPLQNQLVRSGDMILEVWARPSGGVRQTVSRITVRRDGRVFVQARVGIACCRPEIARRVDIDAELPAASAARFQALRDHPMWKAPRSVAVDAGEGDVEGICVSGVNYDLTLVVPGRARHLHRGCYAEAVGEVADALSTALSAPLGQDPRYDVLYASATGFDAARQAYQHLIASGGRLKPAQATRAQPPSVPVAPDAEAPPDANLAPTPPPGPSSAAPSEPRP